MKAEVENFNQLSTRQTTAKSPTLNSGEEIIISFTGHEDLENPVNWSRVRIPRISLIKVG